MPALRPNHRRKKQPVVLAPLKTNRVHAAQVTSAADNVFRPVVTHYKSPIVSMNIDVPVSTRKFLSVPLKKETRAIESPSTPCTNRTSKEGASMAATAIQAPPPETTGGYATKDYEREGMVQDNLCRQVCAQS